MNTIRNENTSINSDTIPADEGVTHKLQRAINAQQVINAALQDELKRCRSHNAHIQAKLERYRARNAALKLMLGYCEACGADVKEEAASHSDAVATGCNTNDNQKIHDNSAEGAIDGSHQSAPITKNNPSSEAMKIHGSIDATEDRPKGGMHGLEIEEKENKALPGRNHGENASVAVF